MKRPILIAVIGYIIGIIVGLYFNKSIVLFYIPILVIYFVNKKIKTKTKKFKLFSLRRYFRYIKIYLTKKVVILLIITSIISNTNVIIQNNNYEIIYSKLSKQEEIRLIGTIISKNQETQFYNKFKVETKFNNKNIKLYIMVNKNLELEYGDKLTFTGTYIKPETQRNYKGFDYSKYLKQIKIYGTIKCNEIKILSKNQANKIFQLSNKLSDLIQQRTKRLLKEQDLSILLGLILGEDSKIDEEKLENFRDASMSHIMAVSGMHVAYLILGISLIFKKLIGKRKTYILSIFILLIYMFLTNFSPSITRAGIMGIIMLFSKVLYRRNDIYTSISISLLLILIYNPFLIQNLGLILSYGGVFGIILFNKTILNILDKIKVKNKIYIYKIRPKIQKYIIKIKEIISISISVQIFILPIILYNLNTLNPYFLISNFILSIIVGPIVILGFIFIIIVLINIKIASYLVVSIQLSIKLLIFISNIGKLPFSKIYIPTLSLFSILIYYFSIIVLFSIFKIYFTRKPNTTQIRLRNIIALLKMKIRYNKNNIKKIVVIIFLILIVIKLVPHNLKIYFVDVGQGDSTFIVTPHNKTILIDGGGSSTSNYDVGKNTLLPYILDRGFTKIDFLFISHFDIDHVGRYISYFKRNRS